MRLKFKDFSEFSGTADKRKAGSYVLFLFFFCVCCVLVWVFFC